MGFNRSRCFLKRWAEVLIEARFGGTGMLVGALVDFGFMRNALHIGECRKWILRLLALGKSLLVFFCFFGQRGL